jgi:hypothetical protein
LTRSVHVFGDNRTDARSQAKVLRGDLQRAGVMREELFQSSTVRMKLRFHDLRGVFVTTALAQGKSEAWVSARTGHRSSQMINSYRRPARTWSEARLGDLANLHDAIPELANGRQSGGPEGGEPGLNRGTSPGESAKSSEVLGAATVSGPAGNDGDAALKTSAERIDGVEPVAGQVPDERSILVAARRIAEVAGDEVAVVVLDRLLAARG